MLCFLVIDAWSTSNEVLVRSMFLLNVMSAAPKVDLYIVVIPSPRDGD